MGVIADVDFGAEQFTEKQTEKYKGKKGRKDRIALVYDVYPLPDKKDPAYKAVMAKIESGQYEQIDGEDKYRKVKILSASVHKFRQGIGYLIESENSAEIMGAEYPAKPRFGVLVVQYRVEPATGMFPKDENGQVKFDYELKPWIFSLKTFKELQNQDVEMPLISHDLRVECTKEDFQELTFGISKDSAWRKNAKIESKILKEAAPLWAQVERALGRSMSDDQLREKLGIVPEGVKLNTSASQEDFDAIAEGLE